MPGMPPMTGSEAIRPKTVSSTPSERCSKVCNNSPTETASLRPLPSRSSITWLNGASSPAIGLFLHSFLRGYNG